MTSNYKIIVLSSLLTFSCSTDKPTETDDSQSQPESALLTDVSNEYEPWAGTSPESFYGQWKMTSSSMDPIGLVNSTISIVDQGYHYFEYRYNGSGSGFKIEYDAESKSLKSTSSAVTTTGERYEENYTVYLTGANQLSLTIDPYLHFDPVRNDIYTRQELKFVDESNANNSLPFHYGMWKKTAGNKNPNSGEFLESLMTIESGKTGEGYYMSVGSNEWVEAEMDDSSNNLSGTYFTGKFTIKTVSTNPPVISLSDDGRNHFEPMLNQEYSKVEYVTLNSTEVVSEITKEMPRELKKGETEVKGTIIGIDDTGIYGLFLIKIREIESGDTVTFSLDSSEDIYKVMGLTTSVYYTNIGENQLLAVQQGGIDIIGGDINKDGLKQITGMLKGANEEFGESSDSPGMVGIVDESGEVLYASLFVYRELFAVNNTQVTGFYRPMGKEYISYIHGSDLQFSIPQKEHFDIEASDKRAQVMSQSQNKTPTPATTSAAPAPTAPPEKLAPEFKTFIHAPAGDFNQSHEDIIMNYVSWDGQNWTAKLKTNTFLHAPNGDFTNAHEDPNINYMLADNSKWTAKVNGTTFTHAPNGDFSSAHKDVVLAYVTWGGGNWTMKIKE